MDKNIQKEFEFKGIKLKSIPMSESVDPCEGCYFLDNDCGYAFNNKLRPSCLDTKREDQTNVIFIEVEDESME